MTEEKESIMKLLLSSPNPSLISWKKEAASRESEYDNGSGRLCNYLQQLSGQIDGSVNTVDLDHNYSRPWNWRPENSNTKPVKTLFVSRITNAIARPSSESIDPENGLVSPVPVYDSTKARILMNECERHIKSLRIEANDPDWETTIDKTDWTDIQKRLFDRVCHILSIDRLARLSTTGSWNEPVLRRISINKTARRFRSTLATICWEPKLVQWLHNLLMDVLDDQYLIAYVEVLQTLKSKIPALIERLLSNPPPNCKWKMDILLMLLQRPWDPAAFGLSCYTPSNLPGNPLLVVVPNGVNSGNQRSSRVQKWHTQLSNLGKVVVIEHPVCRNRNVTITSCLEQMMIATRAKLGELKSDYVGKRIILVGMNTGAALACQVALLEPVAAVVCLGFPFNTVEDKRGQPDDSILNLSVPILFVMGQYASTCSIDDMEDLRERLHVETGLVVIGAADDQLRISKGKQRAEGITQSMVDRCIVDEVGDFIGTILSNPYSANRNEPRPRFKLVEKKRKISIQDEIYGKKQHVSTILTQEGSIFNSTVKRPRMTIPRSSPSSKSKWTAQVHRSLDTKPRISYSQSSSGSVASITRAPGASLSRPSIDNISIIMSANGDSTSNSSLDSSSAKLMSQIKVLGSEECGNINSADTSSLVDHLTPDSLLEMPVIIAQEDNPESPVKENSLIRF